MATRTARLVKASDKRSVVVICIDL